jgi:hypothetical protein
MVSIGQCIGGVVDWKALPADQQVVDSPFLFYNFERPWSNDEKTQNIKASFGLILAENWKSKFVFISNDLNLSATYSLL